MDGKSLEPRQAKRIHEALYPSINYLGRLVRRMEEVGFLPEDPLFLLVKKVFDAMHHLYNELHYLSCKSGVGRAGNNDPGQTSPGE